MLLPSEKLSPDLDYPFWDLVGLNWLAKEIIVGRKSSSDDGHSSERNAYGRQLGSFLQKLRNGEVIDSYDLYPWTDYRSSVEMKSSNS